ncbi:MAG: hypothetical protein Q4F85_03200 [Prevotella sp.]|nr:hypothetical protein [Prevotella sp.]
MKDIDEDELRFVEISTRSNGLIPLRHGKDFCMSVAAGPWQVMAKDGWQRLPPPYLP